MYKPKFSNFKSQNYPFNNYHFKTHLLKNSSYSYQIRFYDTKEITQNILKDWKNIKSKKEAGEIVYKYCTIDNHLNVKVLNNVILDISDHFKNEEKDPCRKYGKRWLKTGATCDK